MMASFVIAQNTTELIQQRLETIPLPDPAEFYGQTAEFAKAVEANYCDTAKTQNTMYLGTDGWLFNRQREIDFGRQSLSIYDLSYDEIVFWLSEYRKALETVGFKDEVMLIIPPKGLLGENHLSEELKNFLVKNKTEAHYDEMRQAYLDAGFENVPDLLSVIRNSDTGTFSFYPVDHHFTPYTASLFAAEAAKAILENTSYDALPKTPVNAVFSEDIFTVIGWEHEIQVENACGTDIPTVYKPVYELEYVDNAPELLSEEKPEIVLTGNSHIGYQFNRPGTDGGYQTPGTGLSTFLAHLTHLPVLNYAVYGLQNSAIEMYLRTDFTSEAPPSYLIQLLEAHAYPYPAYHYRALPALTYGKCASPVFEATLSRAEFWRLDIPVDLPQDTDYYLWLELDEAAQKHTEWGLDEKYSSGKSNTIKFSTDDRFINFPMNFALQLLPEQGNLSYIRVAPESGWHGKSVTVSICDIEQARASYEALGR